jgi:hypothetical protein
MTAPNSWLRRLSIRGAELKAVPGEAGAYGVFPKGDLRRRPLAKVTLASLNHARAEGLLKETSSGGYQLAETLDAITHRRKNDYRTPQQQLGERTLVTPDGVVETQRVNLADSPLARWVKPDQKTGRGWLSRTEFEAGERLRSDYHRSVLSDRVTSNWNGYLAPAGRRSTSGTDDAPVSALAARDRVYSALEFVGPGLDRVLSAVCLRENGLEAVEQAESWPRRSGKAILKVGLQRLAMHYGLISRPQIRL